MRRPGVAEAAVPAPAGPSEHRALAGLLLASGAGHLLRPAPFDSVVPGWLPPSRRFWTVVSGLTEIAVALLLLGARTRRAGGLGAAALFVAVFPANVQMAWSWRHRRWPYVAGALARLPLQVPLVAWGLRVARATAPRR